MSNPPRSNARSGHTYSDAGVDLKAGEYAVSLMKDTVTSTYGPEVLAGIGAFGGLYDAHRLKNMKQPVLVASTDGVGTKTKVASALGRFDAIGEDIVNHCINDILVQGARPLFFLDYVAASRIEPQMIADIVKGAARACRAAGIPLLGGETAEMPGVYVEGEFDLVGTIIGVLDRDEVIDGSGIRAGDRVLALMSGGLQTNGFSLARAVLQDHYRQPFEGSSIGEALLHPHRSYLEPVTPLLERGLVTGMAHITGGGIPGNLPRVLTEGLGATIYQGSWPVPEIFSLIQREGDVDTDEMFRAFNMGAGFLLVVRPDALEQVRSSCPEEVFDIGEISAKPGVRIV
jgi:phosphoribosylformylglycinamidine cyclo-ligase